MFDLFHIGHLNILRLSRERCNRLVAGVVSDEVAESMKGRRPVIPLAERVEIVRGIRYVDDVHVAYTPSKVEAWESVRFTRLFKGEDWRGTAKGELLEQEMAALGVDVWYLPYTVHTSSTLLRAALASPPVAGRSS